MSEIHIKPTRGLLILAGGIFAVILIVALVQGLTVQKIGVLGVDVEFRDKETTGLISAEQAQQIESPQDTARQVELENKIADLERQINEANASQPSPPPPAEAQPASASPIQPTQGFQNEPISAPANFNLSGEWVSDEDIVYIVTQAGSFIAMQEINPVFGLTAAVEGTLEGDRIEANYETVFGTSGTGTLFVSSNGEEISGTFNDVTGITIPVNMRRQFSAIGR